MTETAETQTAITLTEEQERAIEAGRSALAEAAEALTIDDSDSEARGWAIVNRIGELVKMVKLDFAASKQAAHTTWKTIVAQESGWLKRLEGPDTVVRGKLAAYKGEEERLLRAAEAAAREIARKQAEEATRLLAEQAKRQAEERVLAEAAAAEAAGDAEAAQALLDKPIEVAPVAQVVPVIIPTMEIPKAIGAGAMVTVWHYEVVDEALIPREFLIVDMAKIGRFAATMKQHAKIAGIRFWSTLEPRRAGHRPSQRRSDAIPRPEWEDQ